MDTVYLARDIIKFTAWTWLLCRALRAYGNESVVINQRWMKTTFLLVAFAI